MRAQIEACAAEYYDNAKPEYLTEPKMVYNFISDLSRVLFTRKENFAISVLSARNTACTCLLMVREWDMDWAQIKMTLHFVILPCFRMFFYIGGTKCGALFGEALVINAEDIKYRFKAYMKQNGAVLAKGWLMGLQFATMLENGDYFEKTKRADELAMQIKGAFEQKKVPFWVESFTNQQFCEFYRMSRRRHLPRNTILKRWKEKKRAL